eukprot:6656478-Lingulodinium_polyedra.AAC.1
MLTAWLAGLGWENGESTPEQARAWLVTYKTQKLAARKAALPRRLAGQTTRRDRPCRGTAA